MKFLFEVDWTTSTMTADQDGKINKFLLSIWKKSKGVGVGDTQCMMNR